MGLLRQFLEGRATVDDCLRKIKEREPDVRAWVEVNPQPAPADGPLKGVPFGVKDIYEAKGLATEYGSSLYHGRKGTSDAALVTRFRERGAILMGKTQTTAFAYFDPAPTRNPHNLEHTPGGSSSGSAAAVAAGMVPVALGTQTQGSVLRPASFCGVTGFKPTFGLLPTAGILPFARSLDTAGLFTQTADDMQLLWERLGYSTKSDPAEKVGELPAEFPFDDVLAAVRLINNYEGARTHEALWRKHGKALGAKLAQLIEDGLRISDEQYKSAKGTIENGRMRMDQIFARYPVISMPAAPGPAPRGLSSTGDPRMNAPWTGLGVPAISIPRPVKGLPEGLQLIAARNQDAPLLATAVKIEREMNRR